MGDLFGGMVELFWAVLRLCLLCFSPNLLLIC